MDGNYRWIWGSGTKLIIKPGKSQRCDCKGEETCRIVHEAYHANYIFKNNPTCWRKGKKNWNKFLMAIKVREEGLRAEGRENTEDQPAPTTGVVCMCWGWTVKKAGAGPTACSPH